MTKMTYQQVRGFMATLSDPALIELAKGPLPEDGAERVETCRVCNVLEPLAEKSGNQAITDLLDWHDFVAKGYGLIGKAIRGEFPEDIERDLVEELQGLVGDLSYARCAIVYAAAEAELETRRRQRVEDGLDIDGEPPDERDAQERRDDELAEDADRRLDAEKVGDLR